MASVDYSPEGFRFLWEGASRMSAAMNFYQPRLFGQKWRSMMHRLNFPIETPLPLFNRRTRFLVGVALLTSTSACTPAATTEASVPKAALEETNGAAEKSPAAEEEPMDRAKTQIWPEGRRAAVSLTYDDAIPSQRLNAVPALNARGLRGTFFLTGKSDDLKAHRGEWGALLSQGHELGAHTINHPCDKKFDWVPEGGAIQDYDLSRMESELEENRTLLRSLGARQPFSFAYPCGETEVGEPKVSYEPLIAKFFLSARGVEGRLAQPGSDDLNRIPAFDGAKTKEELLALVDRAEAQGAWLVLFFHGVGGDYLSVELAAHEALLESLAARSETVWTATYSEVAAHLKQNRP
jgi:peptidoglycan/xylan/chitin deacetylase (PgdA/CDA1 family)